METRKERGRYIASIGDLEAEGRTVTEAKQNVTSMAKIALRGEYSPIAITYRGQTIIISRDPIHGWGQRLISTDAKEGHVQTLHMSTGSGGRDDEIRSAKMHLAQLGWRPDDQGAPEFLEWPERQEFLRWALWQRRYRTAIKCGLSEKGAREYAAGLPGSPTTLEKA